MPKQFSLTKSMDMHSRALKVLPRGVSSNARLWHKTCRTHRPCSIFIESAKGSHLWDVDGNEYIDYRLGFGPVILGHSYPAVHDHIHKYDEKGIIFALDNPLEVSVAEKIRKLVPSAEMVRFSVTGTEATMHAIRIARGYTGREKVIRFEGQYHGAHDYALFSTEPPFDSQKGVPIPSSLGIPKALRDLIILQEWNDFESMEKTVSKHGNEVAAIICEPVMGNAAVIPPAPGYLKFLKELADKHGVVLIFDEVKTGFRLARGGAQELLGVKPHLSTSAKSLANGYPVSMIGGLQEIMDIVGPKKVAHGGTYTGNPISMAAAEATLDEFETRNVHESINKFGSKLMTGIREILEDRHVDGIVQGFPSMFQVLFTNLSEVRNYRDLSSCDFDLFARLQLELLKQGVMFDEDNGEPLFTCYSHTQEDLEKTLQAFDAALPVALKSDVPVEIEDRFTTWR
ncbi:MAG: aspartate aminotransferase family protein [Thaumarchaeota archaeon]|nr:aspartate aminotransferase family protein [Nitrososphaerota archaeon]